MMCCLGDLDTETLVVLEGDVLSDDEVAAIVDGTLISICTSCKHIRTAACPLWGATVMADGTEADEVLVQECAAYENGGGSN